jgi:hypothetical protein
MMHIDVKNLFFYLPCSFKLKDQQENLTDEIFSLMQPFQQLDDAALGKIRTEGWRSLQLNTQVSRIDYVGDKGNLWGDYDLSILAKKLNWPDETLQKSLQARFEIDHNLQIKLMLCHKDPTYTFTGREPVLSERDIRKELKERIKGIANPLGGDLLEFDIGVNARRYFIGIRNSF